MVTELRKRLIEERAEQRMVAENVKEHEEVLGHTRYLLKLTEEALLIAQQVAKDTQSQLEFHISQTIQLAMSTIFDDPYEVRLVFETRRNKTEADILFRKAGTEEWFKPDEDNVGGGVIDVAAMGLQMAVWQIQRPKSRALFLLDEPFKHLRGVEQQRRASSLLRTLSRELLVQFLIICDVAFNVEADREFALSLDANSNSVVTTDS